jgi:hypothetical protein
MRLGKWVWSVIGSARGALPEPKTRRAAFATDVLKSSIAEPAQSSTSTSTAASTPCWRTTEYSAAAHAEYFLRWLHEEGYAGEYRYSQVLKLYHRMCVEVNWATRPWNPVGHALTRLTTGKKVYRWFRQPDGQRRRLRVYPIFPEIADAESDVSSIGSTAGPLNTETKMAA